MAQGEKPKPVAKYGTEIYECLVCEGKQTEPKGARTRTSRVRCRTCGGTAYPVEGAAAAPAKVRLCKDCGTKLRSTNSTTRCSSCGERR